MWPVPFSIICDFIINVNNLMVSFGYAGFKVNVGFKFMVPDFNLLTSFFLFSKIHNHTF